MTGKFSLSVGDLIDDKYRIERELAAGGMGAVYVAHHEALNKRVCIKLMLSAWAEDAEAAARFRREAQAAGQLRSDHVVEIFDVGTLPDGAPYLVMEYLEGASLRQLLESRGRLEVTESVDFMMQTLRALVEAHAAGIVHRDLKPANLFVERNATGTTLKVLDFGISKLNHDTALASAADNITSSKSILGTPAYMSPEQALSARDVDGRSDIWTVGVILYELLTSELIFDGQTIGAVIAAILQKPIRPLIDVRPDVGRDLDRVVMKCLERDVDARYQTAADVLTALAPFSSTPAASASMMGKTLPAPVGAAAPRGLSTDLTWGTRDNASKGRATPLVLLLAAAMIAAGLFFGLRGTSADAPEPKGAASRGSDTVGDSTASAVAAPSASARAVPTAKSSASVEGPATAAGSAVASVGAPPPRWVAPKPVKKEPPPSPGDGAELDKRN